ncbi:MAG: preprotein translocase subunit SecE [bacterium]|nr:preprotein translocase subunit SecE [bacterium]
MGKIKKYFSGVKKEMKRVRWTGKKDLFKYTIVTIVFVAFLSIFFYLIDLGVATLRAIN